MAQPGYDTPQEPGAKLSAQRARQGQNIKGMVWVLIVSILLVVGAYGVMLALSAQPASVVNESRAEAASAPVQDKFPTSQSQQSQTPSGATPATPSN
jgi:hypothetical protein